jgi:oligosaccharide repeat unit polymerase
MKIDNVFWFYLRILFFLCLPFFIWEGVGVFGLGVFSILSYALSATILAYVSSRSEFKVLTMMFWLFCYLFLIVAGVAQQSAGVFPWLDYYNDKRLDYAWFLVFAGSLSFFVGGLHTFSSIKNFNFTISPIRFRLFSVFAVLVTFVSILTYGGFEVLFMPREEMFSIFDGNVSKTMILQSMIRVPLFICSVVMLRLAIYKYRAKELRVHDCFLLFLVLLAVLLINNPVSTPRFWLACVCITYILIVFDSFYNSYNFKVAALIILMMLVVFPVSDVFRRSTSISIFDYAAEQNLADSIMVSPNFDAFQQLANTLSYVESHGHTWGIQSLSAIFFWVPRSFWESKAVSSGELVALNANYDYLNLSAPLWAEMYLDFGLFGLIFIFYMLGRLVNSLEMNLSVNVRVLACFLASYSMYFYRGSLMSALSFLMITLVFIALMAKRSK